MLNKVNGKNYSLILILVLLSLTSLKSQEYNTFKDRGVYNIVHHKGQHQSKNLNSNSVARLWMEALLEGIRNDYARPTVHARNLFHTSIAFYDVWALHENADPYLAGEYKSDTYDFSVSLINNDNSKRVSISYAAHTLLSYRFRNSPSDETQLMLDDLLVDLDYYEGYNSPNEYPEDYQEAIAFGQMIGNMLIDYGQNDGANEENDYANTHYLPVNPAYNLFLIGNTDIPYPNRWQPLEFGNGFIDQGGNSIDDQVPPFLNPEWGNVTPFALTSDVMSSFDRDGNEYKVYHDPGAPPYISNTATDDSDYYKWGFSLVSKWSSHLSPDDGVIWDISPKGIGNIETPFPNSFADFPSFYNELDGGDIGVGHLLNPFTAQPYETQNVPRGDYTRVLAEFWADGPESETPPGHWFTILNYVNDNNLLIKKFNGEGEVLCDLEWDIKTYFTLGGAMHDAAVSAWGVKGWYDYIRPFSAIRYMASKGQSTDVTAENYHIEGIPLQEGFVEVVKENDPLVGDNNENYDKIKLYVWQGHDQIVDTQIDQAGVGWILAENWWPYQRPSFVTPPFAGYVSGHSTYSRAAAEVLTLVTGDAFFPGGYGEFIANQNEFLVFEEGPSQDIKLQWATYRDASDQCSLSRIWGGIHPPADDIPGRIMGEKIGVEAFNKAKTYFDTQVIEEEEEEETEEEEEELTEVYEDVVMFPVPVIDELTFGIPESAKADSYVNIYTLNGSLVLSFMVDLVETKVNLETLADGMYIVHVITGDQIIEKLIVKE